MSKYSFIDYNYYTKDDLSKDIYNVNKQFDNIQDANTGLNKGVLDPNISLINIKDIEKGE